MLNRRHLALLVALPLGLGFAGCDREGDAYGTDSDADSETETDGDETDGDETDGDETDGDEADDDGWDDSDTPTTITPLVLNLDGAPLSFEPAGAASFDIEGRGECLSTDWPTMPWLALDRDRDGVIADGGELFGSGTLLRSGARAHDGFEALAELDIDGDGMITAADPAFADLVLWSDADNDRRGELRELVPLAQINLVAIHLDYDRRVECDVRGNCGAERSVFEFRGSTGALERGEIIDVHLACQ